MNSKESGFESLSEKYILQEINPRTNRIQLYCWLDFTGTKQFYHNNVSSVSQAKIIVSQ